VDLVHEEAHLVVPNPR